MSGWPRTRNHGPGGVFLLALAALSLAGPADASAQMVLNDAALDSTRPQLVHLRVGFESAFVMGAGYSRALGLGRRTVAVTGSAVVPWARADVHDYGLRLGASTALLGQRRWRLVGGLGADVRGTANALSRITSVGADALLVGGVWHPGWFVAGEAGYDGVLLAHLVYTDEYRTRYYGDARDGWYRGTGANVRLGLVTGVTLGRLQLALRAGQGRHPGGQPQLLPAYATLDLALRP